MIRVPMTSEEADCLATAAEITANLTAIGNQVALRDHDTPSHPIMVYSNATESYNTIYSGVPLDLPIREPVLGWDDAVGEYVPMSILQAVLDLRVRFPPDVDLDLDARRARLWDRVRRRWDFIAW